LSFNNTGTERRGPRIGAVVLAAGLSSRMGVNKLLLPLKGKPLVRHAVDAAAASRCDPVIVVIGDNCGQIEAASCTHKVRFVKIRDFTGGLSELLKCGLRTLPPDCEGVAVLLGDMPFVTSQLIDVLIAAFDPTDGRAICVPVHRGQRGNPVLWDRQFFPEMLALEGDTGAKQLLIRHQAMLYELEVADDGPLTDIDTPEDLAAYEAP